MCCHVHPKIISCQGNPCPPGSLRACLLRHEAKMESKPTQKPDLLWGPGRSIRASPSPYGTFVKIRKRRPLWADEQRYVCMWCGERVCLWGHLKKASLSPDQRSLLPDRAQVGFWPHSTHWLGALVPWTTGTTRLDGLPSVTQASAFALVTTNFIIPWLTF